MRSAGGIVCILVLFCAPVFCFAQAAPASPPAAASRQELEALREALAAQQRQIDVLKAELAALKAQQPAAVSPSPAGGASPAQPQGESPVPGVQGEKLVESAASPSAGFEGRHFFIQTRDGQSQFQPIGYLQLDHRAYSGSTSAVNTFVLRRARLGVQGYLTRNIQFRLEGDFADRNGTLLREASLNIIAARYLQFRFGQFKEPFSQELVTSDSDLDFVERSLASNVIMGSSAYTPGAAVHGEMIGRAVEYDLGAFNARGPVTNSDTSTPEVAFRLRLSPWRNTSHPWLKGLIVGGAVTDGRTHNAGSFSAAMPTGTFTFFSTQKVNGKVLRTNGELNWTRGPAAIRAEYSQGRQERLELGTAGADLPALSAKAYYVMGTYLLTGEKQPETGQAAPAHPAFGKGPTGMGAWELKFRYSGQHMLNGLQNTLADEFSTGFNWYLTPAVSYVFDVNLERLRSSVVSPTPLAPQNFVTVLSRMQFRF